MGLPENLKSIRKKHHLSQKNLADDLGVAQASINYWEKGQRTPSIEAVKSIAEYFHVTVDDLLGDGVEWRRFLFHGTKEQQEKLEAALSKDGVSRKTIYMILKYLTINPDCQDILQKQFPDVQQVLLQNECPEWIL